MPAQAPPVTDERSALTAYLIQQQDAFRSVIYGLSDEQAACAASKPSVLSVGSLLKHVTATSEALLQSVLASPELPVDDRSMDERYAANVASWTWHSHDTVTTALAAYDEVCGQVLEAVASADLEGFVPVPPAPWNPTDIDGWSVRWVWFHLIEELARHAGHADIVREAVDGATMYELVAGRAGWPPTDWLTPWHRADD